LTNEREDRKPAPRGVDDTDETPRPTISLRPAVPFPCWRADERILAGPNPVSEVDVSALAAQGVTHVLDLRQEREWNGGYVYGHSALAAYARHGISRKNVPIEDGSAPSPEALDAAFAFVAETVALPGSLLYAHCYAGIERTATILCAWRCRTHGESFDTALTALRSRGWPAHPLPWQRQAVEGWVEDFEE